MRNHRDEKSFLKKHKELDNSFVSLNNFGDFEHFMLICSYELTNRTSDNLVKKNIFFFLLRSFTNIN